MSESITETTDRSSPDRPELDQYVSYPDDGDTVICDRENPSAWIRSDELRSIER